LAATQPGRPHKASVTLDEQKQGHEPSRGEKPPFSSNSRSQSWRSVKTTAGRVSASASSSAWRGRSRASRSLRTPPWGEFAMSVSARFAGCPIRIVERSEDVDEKLQRRWAGLGRQIGLWTTDCPQQWRFVRTRQITDLCICDYTRRKQTRISKVETDPGDPTLYIRGFVICPWIRLPVTTRTSAVKGQGVRNKTQKPNCVDAAVNEKLLPDPRTYIGGPLHAKQVNGKVTIPRLNEIDLARMACFQLTNHATAFTPRFAVEFNGASVPCNIS
jgi:hypothetical protein